MKYHSIFLIATTAVASFISLLLGSEWLSKKLSPWLIQLVNNQQKTTPFIKYEVIFIVSCIFIILFAWCIYLYIQKKELREKLGSEPKQIFLEYDQFLRSTDEMKGIIYSEDKIDSRYNVLEKNILHTINCAGDTYCEQEFIIECAKDSLHFFGIGFFTDDEGEAIYGYTNLDIDISYQDRKTNNSWHKAKKSHFIPSTDNKRSKKLLIFFEEMSKGQQRKIKIKYSWPGFWKQLLKRGSTVFEWTNEKRPDGSVTKFQYKWVFSKKFPKIIAKVSDNSDHNENRLKQYIENGHQIVEYNLTKSLDGDSIKFWI